MCIPVKTEWWDANMAICLGLGADLHMAQLMPLPLTIFATLNPDWFLVLLFWYCLTLVLLLQQPFYGPLDFVQDYPGQLAPER